jgi:hypothetical protein
MPSRKTPGSRKKSKGIKKKSVKKKSVKKPGPGTRASRDQALVAERHRVQQAAGAAAGGPTHCPPGHILRAAYPRKQYSHKSGARVSAGVVPRTCVPATGKALETGHKGKQLFVLQRGVLSKFGYHDVRTLEPGARHTALRAAFKDVRPASLAKKLNALYVLNMNKDKNLAKIYKDDERWVKSTSEYAAR